ncbi:polyphosphoinositide phosphatase-like isoform X1 [Mytilus edulis]|uniref:polyphosphoinositide phosphatase-like isoform X1 n=1 Tax=Mytilus edulis TaxID=6550 RepID=UPI0039EEB67C
MDRSIISCIQKVVLYETKARIYVVGSNTTETQFRVLKIDRTESRDLVIHDDKAVYTQIQIRNLLTMINHGNQPKDVKSDAGLIKTISAFGIVGFVKFLEGYYIIVITQRAKVAVIGPHVIYKVMNTAMIPIPNDTVKYTHPDESRYKKLFESVDLSSNFYFSYSYDLTHSLQFNMMPVDCVSNSTDLGQSEVFGIKNRYAQKYLWNKFLIKPCKHILHTDWFIPIIHGFVDQKHLCIFGKALYITLIARRSIQFAGTRFLKRGANSEGYVANEVETEQIVHDASITFLDRTKLTSFVQMRGSVPLFWSQDVSTMVPKPAISLDQKDPYAKVSGHHFNQLLHRYGSPVIILNLVKKREKRRHESILSEEYKDVVEYLNQFLPEDQCMRYVDFDMAYFSKRKNIDVLSRLAKIARQCVKKTGLYIKMMKPVEENFWDQEELIGFHGYRNDYGCLQTGVVRTNCVDCLDRTNTAQFAIGKAALAYQLWALGVLPKMDLEFETDIISMLEDLYEAQGDTIALQYGGSQLVHRIEGYRKINPWTAQSKDILYTVSRYYSNTFTDLEKQHATNIFLGVFLPREGKPNIWELPTDYYLHNKDLAGVQKIFRKSYSQWWDLPVFRSLPLPYDQKKKSEDDSTVEKFHDTDERINHFNDYYRPFELTVLKNHFTMVMEHSVRNYKPKSTKDDSPFSLRLTDRNKGRTKKLFRHTTNPNLSGKDSTLSTASTGSDGSSSSSEGMDMEGNFSLSDSDVPSQSRYEKKTENSSSKWTMDPSYGLNICPPSKHDELHYARYHQIGDQCCQPAGYTKKDTSPVEIFPKSVFKFGSIYGVEIPPVNKVDQDIYNNYVAVAKEGPKTVSTQDSQMYARYVKAVY